MPHRYAYLKWIVLKRKIKKLIRSHSSDKDLALGTAIGFFVGFLPIMGIQMVVAAGLAAIWRVSKLAAILPVWISNPMTFIPLYGFNYLIGHKITGLGPGPEEYHKVLHEVHKMSNEYGFFEGIIEGSKHFASMGVSALVSLLIGSVIAGAVVAAISYPVTVKMVRLYRHRRHLKRARRHERISEIIRIKYKDKQE